MNISENSLEKINIFMNFLDDLINENYLYIDQKITQMMNCASQCPEIYELLKKNLSNTYNLSIQIENSSAKNNNGKFIPPRNKKDFLEFTFSLLIELGTKKRNFLQFLYENFNGETQKEIQQQFKDNILLPFKQILIDYFTFINNGNQKNEEVLTEQPKNKNVDNIEIEKKYIGKITEFITQMINIIKNDLRIKENLKENLLYTLNGILYSSKYNDMRLIATQLNCFDLISKKVKSIELIYNDLKAMLKNYFGDYESQD